MNSALQRGAKYMLCFLVSRVPSAAVAVPPTSAASRVALASWIAVALLHLLGPTERLSAKKALTASAAHLHLAVGILARSHILH